MRILFIFATVLLSPLLVFSANEAQLLRQVENKVEAMYNDLKIISQKESSTASSKRAFFVENYFTKEQVATPNEFIALYNIDEQQSKRDIHVRTYITNFYEFFRKERYVGYTFAFENRNIRIMPSPQFTKGESKPELAHVIVRKSYIEKGFPKFVFDDTLIVEINGLKIFKWTNQCSKLNEEILDYEQMKANAIIAYNDKQYNKAYSIYEEITRRYPDEGEPFYRMAVMLYEKSYDGGIGRKKRNALILKYLDEAIGKKYGIVRKWATNMKYWITC